MEFARIPHLAKGPLTHRNSGESYYEYESNCDHFHSGLLKAVFAWAFTSLRLSFVWHESPCPVGPCGRYEVDAGKIRPIGVGPRATDRTWCGTPQRECQVGRTDDLSLPVGRTLPPSAGWGACCGRKIRRAAGYLVGEMRRQITAPGARE